MTVENAYVATLPLILSEVEVVRAERVSPSFVRVELGGAALAELGTPGPVLDQRFKIIFPNAAGDLPSFADADASWWTSWMEIPEDERGSMRTYTVRDVLGEGTQTRLVVDIVVHEAHEDDPLDGAGNKWALQARAGQRLVIMAPRRGHEFGGIEWSPGDASRLLLVGDETAVPAIRGVLRDLPADASGAAFLEVPVDGDVLDDVTAPAGVSVTWLPRNGGARGEEPARGGARPPDRQRAHRVDRRHRRGDRPGPVGDPGVLLLRRAGGRGHRRTGRRGAVRRPLRLDRR
nr:siderophore-interacting protein [Nocardioides convexus]